MRIGFVPFQFTIGDLAGNRDLIITHYRKLVADGAELVVFPELALCGCPPGEWMLRPRFAIDVESALLEVAAATGPVPALVGALDRNTDPQGRPFYNAAAICHDGVIQGFARKVRPTRDGGADETRFFAAADRLTVFAHQGWRIGVTLDEDPAVSSERDDGFDLLIQLGTSLREPRVTKADGESCVALPSRVESIRVIDSGVSAKAGRVPKLDQSRG